MTLDRFWSIVEKVHRASGGDMDKKCEYVPTTVEKEISGGQLFLRSRPCPNEPSGEPWMEHEVAGLFPKLAEKYGYTD